MREGACFLRILGRGINFRGEGLFSEKQMNTDQHRLLGLINNDDDHNEKQIGLQCVLVSLCLVLFHSV